jgi:ABC-2 type transport system permease protein
VTSPEAAIAGRSELPAKRAGIRNWFGAFAAMVRWEVSNMRLLLPLTAMVQALSGAGLVLGFGLLLDEVSEETALFLSTGAVVITLVLVGLILGPQLVAQQKMSGSYDFLASLPVPKSAASAAWITLNVALALPGMVTALLVAMWRYDVTFTISWSVIPAVALTLITGTLLGLAMSHAIPKPEVTQLVSQILIFAIFGFSPIAFPAENLPAWLATMHDYLPFGHMANVVRDAFTTGLAENVPTSYAILVLWALGAAALSTFVLRRRA